MHNINSLYYIHMILVCKQVTRRRGSALRRTSVDRGVQQLGVRVPQADGGGVAGHGERAATRAPAQQRGRCARRQRARRTWRAAATAHCNTDTRRAL